MQFLHAVTLVVPDYDPAIEFYCGTLGWQLAEDVDQGRKRWVRILPPGASQGSLILARADTDAQRAIIGNQFGGRVGLFLTTDDFARDHAAMVAAGVQFNETPRHEPYGTVAVWQDPFGNRWDLIQPA
ncbi:VOC family protein [Phaeobacter italicus]|jgi:catechol 2,3-dioxygenase-like lactoylglutathione lyase family enzyme|uniref:Putative enzyme related to lactoylglutathione lyase n=1 Tax=Phaeobacter italicus TaxID=481446 RepID=A0A0H5CZW6_9RHOB|nr:VOC family protein [Phaeobacter italicus]MEC8015084.1 VOC family protein [Pseudomonadota bacterium]MBY6044460.1 VOC family protein [Phaeobacter italicus]MCA0855753.1 VOC family protein [Phaeobacter italicus]MCI5101035.1 VOC family protein [Phaeobacter italicus]MEE2817463.1 VOC family protein [Pseudomonadota bacterium]